MKFSDFFSLISLFSVYAIVLTNVIFFYYDAKVMLFKQKMVIKWLEL